MLDDKEFVMNPDRLALVPLPPISELNGISQNARGKHQESAGKVIIDLSSDDEDNARPPLNTSTPRKTMSGNQRKNAVSGRQKSSQVRTFETLVLSMNITVKIDGLTSDVQTPANETVDVDTEKSKCKYCKVETACFCNEVIFCLEFKEKGDQYTFRRFCSFYFPVTARIVSKHIDKSGA
jgi:hypothetical protein